MTVQTSLLEFDPTIFRYYWDTEDGFRKDHFNHSKTILRLLKDVNAVYHFLNGEIVKIIRRE